MNRRHVLELMGFSLAATGCQRGPVRQAVPFVDKPEEMTPGEALWYATTCRGCDAGCGLLVKTRDGRPIKVEGNPDSWSGGGTCAVGQASVLAVYDEARLRGPRWQGEAVGWDELDRRVGERLMAIAAAGHKMAIITGTGLGPSTRALVDEWRERFPTTRHVAYDPVSTAALGRAYAEAYGQPLVPRYRFDRARAVVGLEADFLGTWRSPVEQTRAYAAGRRLGPGELSMSWHAQFESRLSLTGANADLRVPVNASEVGRIALGLYARLAALTPQPLLPRGEGEPDFDAPVRTALDEAAAALWRERGHALVVCGLNDMAVQTVVAAINELLEATDSTLVLERPVSETPGAEGELARLVEEMQRGEIHALVVYGVNPVYDTPLGNAFREGLERVAFSISFTSRVDETGGHVTAMAPDHHPLESWDDHEPWPGRRTLSQPTLRPLFDTRAAQASLLRYMRHGMASEADWHAYLRETWRRDVLAVDSEESFERAWTRAVHDGEAPVTDVSPSRAEWRLGDLGPAAAAIDERFTRSRDARGAGLVDLILYEKVAIRDGRGANNPWLQEVPDPISRAAWGNYAAMAPAMAERLGLGDGDVVRLEADGRTVDVPVLRQPGQADGTVAVALGYGRWSAGKAADGVGGDAYSLVALEDGLFGYVRTGVNLTPMGRYELVATAQKHGDLEGRPILKETTLASYRGDPAAGNHDRHKAPPRLWPDRQAEGQRWGMTIDYNACVGCSACVVACQAENNIPVVGKEELHRGRAMHWIRIDRYYRGAAEDPDVAFQPMMCQHCADAPCESVCPVLATVHSSDGLNQQIYNRCVGTRYCANNCPYKVRRFNWFNYAKNDHFDFHMTSDLGTLVLNPDVVVRSRGVMEKCSMCVQRIQAGKLQAKLEDRPLKDGDIRTACQEACPADAITFGDLNDGTSQVAGHHLDPRFYHVLEELNTRPAVGYLTRVRHRPEEKA